MKKFLAAVFAAMTIAGSVHAAPYTFNVTASTFYNPSAPGLSTRAWILSDAGPQLYLGSDIEVHLDAPGDFVDVPVFRLVTFDVPIGDDDYAESPISASFTLGSDGKVLEGVSGAILGETYALARNFTTALFSVAPALAIRVSLFDTVYGSADGIFVNGRPGAGTVVARFELAQVPAPAAGILLAGGLFGLMAMRRRKTEA